MKFKKMIVASLLIFVFASCEKKEELTESPILLENTVWKGSERFNCHKTEGCVEYQIIRFTSGNEFTFEYIDGEDGTYDTILSGTYTYSDSELILQLETGTLTAILNGNKICLDSGSDCSETSSETLIKQ